MSFVQTIVFSLLNSLLILFYTSNLLINPLSKKMKMIIFLYVFVIGIMFHGKYWHFIEPISILGVFLGISKLQKNIIMTGNSVFFGYIITTNIKNCIDLILYYRDISIWEVTFGYQLIIFIFLFVVIVILTGWIGEEIRFFLFNMRNENLDFFSKIIFIEFTAITIFYMFCLFYRNMYDYSFDIFIVTGTLITLGITFFILRAILIARIFDKKNKKSFEQTEYQKVQEYITFLEKKYVEFRTFKHDYNNILVSMNAYIEEGKEEELKAYFQTNILPTGSKLNEKGAVPLHFNKIQILEIKGLLYRKTVYALNRDIGVSLDIKVPLEKVGMDGVDLARVLGIFMDNAIEGALETEERQIAITIDVKDASTMIAIYNSCIEKTLNISILYEIGYSTKGEKRGIGLFSARETIRKYSNVTHATSCENNIFMQQLDIYARSEAKYPKMLGNLAL